MLIEQSIAKQYGVLPSEQGSLKFSDWSKMVSGLMEDTRLGRMVELRMLNDPQRLRQLTPEQKRLRAEWADFLRLRRSEQGPVDNKQQQAILQIAIASLFGGKVK